jgi:putative lipoprotein
MDRELLTGQPWEVIEIGGEPLELERLPSMEFTDEGRVAGSTGVNRLMGSFELDGSNLKLSQLATTMMAGLPEAMKAEARLVQALGGGGEVELHLLVRNPETDDTVRLRAVAVEPEDQAEPEPAVEDIAPDSALSEAGTGASRADVRESIEWSAPAPAARPAPPAVPAALRDGMLRGNVVYRERIAMPVGAVVMVRLLDTSRADAPAEVIGQQVIREASQVPVAFEIGYDPDGIDGARAYAAAAQIVVDGQVAWQSTMHHPVLTRGAGHSATIMVSRVGR